MIILPKLSTVVFDTFFVATEEKSDSSMKDGYWDGSTDQPVLMFENKQNCDIS